MKLYRINVSGTKFFLSKRNLYSDAPNLFTEWFETKPKKETRKTVDTNPRVFETIHRHLQGYGMFSSSPIGTIDSIAVTTRFFQDVIHDAVYFKLKKLEEMCGVYLNKLTTSRESREFYTIDHITDTSTSRSSSSSDEEDTEDDSEDLPLIRPLGTKIIPTPYSASVSDASSDASASDASDMDIDDEVTGEPRVYWTLDSVSPTTGALVTGSCTLNDYLHKNTHIDKEPPSHDDKENDEKQQVYTAFVKLLDDLLWLRQHLKSTLDEANRLREQQGFTVAPESPRPARPDANVLEDSKSSVDSVILSEMEQGRHFRYVYDSESSTSTDSDSDTESEKQERAIVDECQSDSEDSHSSSEQSIAVSLASLPEWLIC